MQEEPAEHLLQRAADGDQDAWDALVGRFQGLVWGTVRGHRLEDQEAADVVQTTWLRLVEHLHEIRDPARLGGWLATTARRECLRTLRAKGRNVPMGENLELEADIEAPPLESHLLDDERDQALWRAFRRISQRCQALLRLLMADPAPSYEEIGAALDMPIGSIGPTRGRCLEVLRRALAAEGITAA